MSRNAGPLAFLGLLVLLLSPPDSLAFGFPNGYTAESYEAALAKARRSGKPIMLYFTQYGCRYCDIIEGFLDTDELRGAFVPNYHFVVIDVTRNLRGSPFQKAMMARFKYRATPTFVFLTPAGKHLCTSYGGLNHRYDGLALHRFVQTKKGEALPEDNPAGFGCGRIEE